MPELQPPPQDPTAADAPADVIIIGGGFAGVSTAVQLARASRQALRIALVDPAEAPGRGLAYGTTDPDHRLNAPTFVHSLWSDDINHFSRWWRDQGLHAQDPEALETDGCVYARRADFGRYITETLRAHAGSGEGDGIGHRASGTAGAAEDAQADATAPHLPGQLLGHPGTRIRHHRALAVGIEPGGMHRWQVLIQDVARAGDGPVAAAPRSLQADAVVVATGWSGARLPQPLQGLAGHEALVADPLTPAGLAQLAALPRQARVLVVGNGLSALDTATTLVRAGRAGRIDLLSRHGLDAQPQGPWPPALQQLVAAHPGIDAVCDLPPSLLQDRIDAAPPPEARTVAPTARAWIRMWRQSMARAVAEGQTWHAAFDALRDTLEQTWPRLPAAQRRRLLRRVRHWYDTHRFRTPPGADRIVQAAIAAGTVHRLQGHLLAVEPTAASGPENAPLKVTWRPHAGATDTLHVDAVVNCTGMHVAVDDANTLARTPLMARALADGLLTRDGTGTGLAVDDQARAIGGGGKAATGLHVVGPATFGARGSTIGAIYIAAQCRRVVATLLAERSARTG